MFVTLNNNYNTRVTTNHLLDTPKILTVHYGKNSARSKDSDGWSWRKIETLNLPKCDSSLMSCLLLLQLTLILLLLFKAVTMNSNIEVVIFILTSLSH